MRAFSISLLAIGLAFPCRAPLVSQAIARQGDDSRVSLLRARLRTLNLAMDFANEAPDAAEARLEQAIEALYPFAPEIAVSREARRDQRRAVLTLARTQLNNHRIAQARMTLRELFSVDPPRESEFTALGPSLSDQAREARATVDNLPQGVVEIECSHPCAAYLNERRIPLVSYVPNGEYRLFIHDQSGSTTVMQKRIELRGDKALVRVRFENSAPPALAGERATLLTPRPQLPSQAAPPPSPLSPTAPGRVAPLWLEITGLTLGTGLAVAGGLLMTKERTPCAKRDEANNCIKDRSYKEPGIAMLVGGVALVVTSAIFLVLDDGDRNRQRKKVARLLQGQVRF